MLPCHAAPWAQATPALVVLPEVVELEPDVELPLDPVVALPPPDVEPDADPDVELANPPVELAALVELEADEEPLDVAPTSGVDGLEQAISRQRLAVTVRIALLNP
jgi:hypothetical protein